MDYRGYPSLPLNNRPFPIFAIPFNRADYFIIPYYRNIIYFDNIIPMLT